MKRSLTIFAEMSFFEFSRHLTGKAKTEILSQDPDYMLNVNETEYIEHLISTFTLDPIRFNVADVTADTCEQMIPAERFPHFGHRVTAGQSYSKQVFRFYVPFTGTEDLLGCNPSTFLRSTFQAEVASETVSFELVDYAGDGAQVKVEKENRLKALEVNANYLAEDVRKFNASLRLEAQTTFQARKAEILRQRKVAASVGVPIRTANSIPGTFAVPTTVRRKISPRPQASTGSFIPEPSIDETVYQEILQVIQDTGRVFERLPSTYADKDEESLRDHLILQLEPRFEGSTTGETFNKSGKTDILMRYENKNVFVAECKFWKGQKAHLEAIDQILSYLTWRDSKAALVYFMQSKEMTEPLKAVQAHTSEHPCFVASRDKKEESWFNYEFHLPGDNGRAVRLAILCFHLPPTHVRKA
jgi:hypothetical protein